MSAGGPSVAVIIPAHNESRFIGSLLQSIEQYGPPGAQIIVVDNGSTDGTDGIASARGATVVRLESKAYPSLARNLGAARASHGTEILVFLDADVLLTPEWRDEWSKIHAALRSNPMQITGGTCDIGKQPSWIERIWFASMRQRKRTDLDGANLITTRNLFQELGGFDAALETAEDVDICARARKKGARIVLNNAFRVHHEGYPKTIASFVRRERWHGKGALSSLTHALRSPVTLATIAFAVLHLIALALILAALFGRVSYFVPLTCVVFISALCLASVLKKFPHQRFATLPQTLCVMYVYYIGRSLSIWDAAMRMMSKSDTANTRVRSHR